MSIASSELILNPDGSIYHLNLRPEHIAHNIIFVGDQDRISRITKHFDSIEFATQKREFRTETGMYKGKRLTVISTGIGPDNIDIVLNELDALVNVNLETRTVRQNLTSLNIIRIGTSGSLHRDIPVDGFVMSAYGLGMDNMMRCYDIDAHSDTNLENAFIEQTNWDSKRGRPYVTACSPKLEKLIESDRIYKGITATAPGFYGAQGRVLRLGLVHNTLNDKLAAFNYNGTRVTNLEMETAAIYGLSKLLGHNALSLNAIVANRAAGEFSQNPDKTIDELITYTLNKIAAV